MSFSHNRLNLTPGSLYVDKLAVRHILPIDMQNNEYSTNTIFAVAVNGELEGYNPVTWFSSIGYTDPSTIEGELVSSNIALNKAIDTANQSTVAGLGSAGYISTSQLTSTVAGLMTTTPVSLSLFYDTLAALGNSPYNYVSSSQLASTVAGLGSAGYVSTNINGIMSVKAISTGNVTTSTVTFRDIATSAEAPLYSQNGSLYFNGVSLAGSMNLDVTSVKASAYVSTATVNTQKLATPHQLMVGGSAGSIQTSATGGDLWGGSISIFGTSLSALYYIRGIWYALGSDGGGASFKYSTDGSSWTTVSTFNFKTVYSLAYNGSLYMAAVDNGDIYTSIDGISWTLKISDIMTTVSSLLYTGSNWIAAGTTIKYSYDDGATWITSSGTIPSACKSLAKNANIIIVTDSSTITYSIDNGINWTAATVSFTGQVNTVIWNTAYFVAGGNDTGLGGSPIKYSRDGRTWFNGSGISTSETITSTFWTGTKTYAATTAAVYESTNYGRTWTALAVQPSISPYASITYSVQDRDDLITNNTTFYSADIPHYYNSTNQIYGAADKIVINDTLNVQVGTIGIMKGDPSADYHLDVAGAINASTIYISSAQFNDVTAGGRVGVDFAGGMLRVNGVPAFQSTVAGLGSAGYVSTLDLTSTVAGLGSAGYLSSGFLFTDGTVGAPSISFVNNTNTGIYRPVNKTIGFSIDGTEKMRINASGNVGIGTTNPSYVLDVSGTARIRKIVMPNGIAINRSNTANTNQDADSIAIGDSAGETSQGDSSLAIGAYCGRTNQGTYATAVGYAAGTLSQGQSAIALGNSAGQDTQGSFAIAIGSTAGQTSQGSNAIAIGRSAGQINQRANSIVLNATGSAINGDLSNATYIAPIRNVPNTTGTVLYYDPIAKEVCYDALANENALSTVAGLGQIYISTSSLTSTVAGLGQKYVSTDTLYQKYVSADTLQVYFTSTVAGLGQIYMSTDSVTSTLAYALPSTVAGIGTSFITQTSLTNGLTSTVAGLGTAGYVSTTTLDDTIKALGQTYISTETFNYGLTSTVAGLGTVGYLSTGALNAAIVSTLRLTIQTNKNTPYRVDLTNDAAINNVSAITRIREGVLNSITLNRPQLLIQGRNTPSDNYDYGIGLITDGTSAKIQFSSPNPSITSSAIEFYNRSIGIGTSYPDNTYALDISGNLNVSGTVKAGSLDTVLTFTNLNIANLRTSTIIANSDVSIDGSMVIGGSQTTSWYLNRWICGAPAADNSGTIYYSDNDGVTWRDVSGSKSIFTSQGGKALWNGTQWVMTGSSLVSGSRLAYSSDGLTWIDCSNSAGGGSTSLFTTSCVDVAYNGQIWVACGRGNVADSSGCIAYSSDGRTWTRASGIGVLTQGANVPSVNCIKWNGYMWLAGISVGKGVGSSVGYTIPSLLYSYNGINWTQVSGSIGIFNQGCTTIEWNGTIWLAGGYGDVSPINSLAYSYDGFNWTGLGNSAIGSYCTSLKWNGQLFVATTYGTLFSAPGSIITSPDGFTWTNRGYYFGAPGTTPDPYRANGLGWNGRKWLVSGYGPKNQTMVSSRDGITWTSVTNDISGASFNPSYSIDLEPDLQMKNFNIYAQNVPNYLTSSNQILVGASTITLNNVLTINKEAELTTIVGGVTMFGSTLRVGDANLSTNSIRFYGTTGDGSLQTPYSHTVIAERVYAAPESSELLLFKGNDVSGASGPDRIRHLAQAHQFDLLPSSGERQWTDGSGVPAAGISSALYIDGSGGVGLGRTNIGTSRLSLLTNDRYDWTQGDGLGDFNILNSARTIGLSLGTVSGGAGAGNSAIWTTGGIPGSSGALTFGTNQTTRMTIDASGRVGIGTTPSANYRLTIDQTTLPGAIFVNGVIDNARNRATDGGVTGAAYGFLSNENLGMYRAAANTLAFTTATNERMRIDGSGNVGINNATPSKTLDIIGQMKLSQYTTQTYSATEAFRLFNNTANPNGEFLSLHTGLGLNSYSQITEEGDKGIIYEGKGFTLAPWITNGGGIRLDSSGNPGMYCVSGSSFLIKNEFGDCRVSIQPSGATGEGILKRLNGTNASFDILNSGTGGINISANNLDYNKGITLLNNGNIGVNRTNPTFTLDVSGNGRVTGSFSKGSGTFDIKHPILPNKRLVHSFIEGPRCDNIYRGEVQLVDGSAIINIDKDCVKQPESAMTEGTFEALCANPMVYLQNNETFDRVKGTINGNKLHIICENANSTAKINWIVIGERKDQFIKSWERTNEEGYLITEYNE